MEFASKEMVMEGKMEINFSEIKRVRILIGVLIFVGFTWVGQASIAAVYGVTACLYTQAKIDTAVVWAYASSPLVDMLGLILTLIGALVAGMIATNERKAGSLLNGIITGVFATIITVWLSREAGYSSLDAAAIVLSLVGTTIGGLLGGGLENLKLQQVWVLKKHPTYIHQDT
jgi:hypothetical protein